MASKLLIRAYNVGCGDCVYVRIPGGDQGFHILIDCGKKGDDVLLKKAIDHLKTELPAGKAQGKKRLDLVVATHRHEDHIKGFDADWFDDVEVGNVWLSVAMDPKHPQSEGVRSLRQLAHETMSQLAASGRALGDDMEALAALYGVSNQEADDLLMKKIPKANKIEPRFVHSGMKPKDQGLKLPRGAAIHVLAPERDVDGYYLGKDADATLRAISSLNAQLGATAKATSAPKNISQSDFELLQSRMMSNGLAFAAKESSIQNNLSVVLLIEWKKRRLLFVGDAEWEGEYAEGKHNGSWNVMWEKHKKTHLSKPVDFLKVGHHGSTNATPHPPSMRPDSKKKPTPDGVYAILDTILPVPSKGAPQAKAIVSTEREFYAPIPESELLVELARRVANTRNYADAMKKAKIDPATIWITSKAKKNNFYEQYEKPFLDQPQPWRTDLETLLDKSQKGYVEVEFDEG
jgi:beta-lactamase superfamily II metal-dependent hydrolase